MGSEHNPYQPGYTTSRRELDAARQLCPTDPPRQGSRDNRAGSSCRNNAGKQALRWLLRCAVAESARGAEPVPWLRGALLAGSVSLYVITPGPARGAGSGFLSGNINVDARKAPTAQGRFSKGNAERCDFTLPPQAEIHEVMWRGSERP